MCRGFHHRDIRRVHNYGYRGVRLGLDRRQNKDVDTATTAIMKVVMSRSIFTKLIAERDREKKYTTTLIKSNDRLKAENEKLRKGKDYHRLGKEIADLLKDPEAMRGITLERSLSKLGYIKKSVVMSRLPAEKKYPELIDGCGVDEELEGYNQYRSDLLKAMGGE